MIKYRKKWKYNKNEAKYLLLLVPLLIISIGYAMLNVNVGMTGRTQIGELTWNVAVNQDDITFTDGTATHVNTSAPTVNGTTISYDISLPDLGDYYEFEIKIRNNGSIPAKLANFVAPENKSYIQYSYKYKDGSEIQLGDSLRPGESTTVVIKIKFYLTEQLSQEELDNLDTTLNETITYGLIQANPDELTNSYVDPPIRRKTTNVHATVNELPNDLLATDNLYTTYLSVGYPNSYCIDINCTWSNNGNENIVSMTIPVISGDHIVANSFKAKEENGSGITDGVRVTFLDDANNVINSLSSEEVYTAYTTDGYVTVPANTTAVNVPFYTNDDSNILYILNPENE